MVSAAGKDGALPDQLLRDLLTYQAQYRELPSSLFTSLLETGEVGTNEHWVGKVAENVTEATCLLERMDGVLAGFGVEAAPIASSPGDPSNKSAWPWLLGVGAAAGAYAAWRLARGRA